MRNSNAVVIRAVADALKNKILPELKSEAAQQIGHLSLSLLGLLMSRETKLSGIIDEAQQQLQSLHARMQQVIARYATSPNSAVTDYPLTFLNADKYDARHSLLVRSQELVRAAAARLIEIRQISKNPDDCRGINLLLEEMAKSDLDLTDKFFASLATASPSVAIEAASPVTRETLEQYLIERFPDRKSLAVSNVAGAGHSMSKQILFFDVKDATGKEEELVMRQEKAVKFLVADCTLIKNEYQLIKCAFELGLPVPEPLWLETGAKLGPDFMVMRKVRGAQIGDPFNAFQPLSEDMVMQIAELLAKLHGAGLEPFESFLEFTGQKAILGMNTTEATLYRIGVWEKCFDNPNQYPNPGKIWLFDWLKRNVPNNGQRPVLVHGDFNIHNMLAENDRITACLDWEFGHPGDPLEDLNNVRRHVEKYSDWERFRKHYIAHGGLQVEFDERVLSYNMCLTNAIYSAASSCLAWHVGNGDINDLASVFGSNCYGYEFHKLAMDASLKKQHGSPTVA